MTSLSKGCPSRLGAEDHGDGGGGLDVTEFLTPEELMAGREARMR